MPTMPTRAPIKALPPGKGRDTSALSPRPAQGLQDEPNPWWWDMPAGPERNRESMLDHCDKCHKRGRTDLARACSDGFKLGWKPSFGTRPAPTTAPLSFDDGGVEPEPETETEPDMDAADYDPFARQGERR